MIQTIGFLALLFYLLTTGLIAYKVKNRSKNTDNINRNTLSAAWIAGILCHAVVLYAPFFRGEGLHLDFFTASSHIMWLASLLLLITSWTRRVQILALIVLPITSLVVLVSLIGGQVSAATAINGGLATHILLSLLGYSFLLLATLQALLLNTQNRHLHNHQPGGVIKLLPPLQDMENLLFRLLLTGTLLMFAGLLTGFIFLDDLFGKQVMHKTVLSIIALIVYTILLVGHWRLGWRGKTAVKWTLAAFVLLVLAFFGSKFVYEFLLR